MPRNRFGGKAHTLIPLSCFFPQTQKLLPGAFLWAS